MKRSFVHFSILFFITLRIVVLSSCANIIPPGGGPRDSLPPILLSAIPKDSAVNVSVATKNITLSFDEYVQQLQSVQDNLIISPTMKNSPQVDSKLRNVTLKLRDSLEPNTTYSFNFGESIKDVNENNTAKGITYVFSTGSTIDYNTYSGKVILAETGKIDSTLLVVLHKNLTDTAVIKDMPRYYTRVDGNGGFIFRNLPKGNFAVYALEKSFSQKYDDSTKLFAFRYAPVNIGTNTPITDTLFAYQEFQRKEKTPLATAVKLPASRDDKRLKYTIDFENGQQDILKNLTLTFTRKLTVFDSTKFILYDSNYNKLSGYSLSLDTGKTKVILKNPWKEGTPFRLLIAKDAVADSSGTTLAKADTLRFFTKKEADYGSIRIRFTNLDLSRNPVLQFVQNNAILESFPLTQNELVRKLYRPGTYELRILFDANRNGVWDPGQFSAKKQPETVQIIPRQLVIRPNWDNEITIPL